MSLDGQGVFVCVFYDRVLCELLGYRVFSLLCGNGLLCEYQIYTELRQ